MGPIILFWNSSFNHNFSTTSQELQIIGDTVSPKANHLTLENTAKMFINTSVLVGLKRIGKYREKKPECHVSQILVPKAKKILSFLLSLVS